jgi:hypothetical protein
MVHDPHGADSRDVGRGQVMEYSEDVETDVARQESVAGLGAMLGPPLGGLLSEVRVGLGGSRNRGTAGHA